MKQHNGLTRFLSALMAGGFATLAACSSSGDAASKHAAAEAEQPELTTETPDGEDDAFARSFSELELAMQSFSPDLSIDGNEQDPRLAFGDDWSEPEYSQPLDRSGSQTPPETEEVAEAGAEGDDDSSGDGLALGIGDAEAPLEASIDERVAEMIDRLAPLLREMGDERASPVGAMVMLAMLESLRPGLVEAEYGPIASVAASLQFTDEEWKIVEASRRAALEMRDELGADFVDPERFAEAIDSLSTELRSVRSLSFNEVKLCLRVENYGVYRDVQQHDGRYKFLGGRAHPVIVYSELDHFTHAPATHGGVSGFTVNVRQGLRIYRIGTEEAIDTENTLVWQHEPETVLDFSRKRLRDFFIVQVIELPRTLSVGSYRMKVSAMDMVSGEEVEHGIEFDIVADASALRGGGVTTITPRSNYYDPDR